MRFTASKASLRKACGYWLRADVELVEREQSDASIEGTRVHKLIEEDGDFTAETPDLDPAVVTARKYMNVWAIGRPYTKETALGLRPDGKVVHLGTGRESYASLPGGELVCAGTADLTICSLISTEGNEYIVTDWKNGERGAGKAEEQLRLLAAMQCIYAGAKRVHMHSVWLQGDGAPFLFGVMTRMEARAVLAEAMLARGFDEDDELAKPVQGENCAGDYCPLDGLCPAFQKAAELIPVSALLKKSDNPLTLPISNIEMAREAVELFPQVEAVLKAKREELRTFLAANGGELDMGNGQTYKAIQCKGREAFDKDAALKLLERLGAASEDMAPLVRRGNPYKQWKLVGKTEKGE